MIARDHRAVVIRCTATKVTPAEERTLQKSQFAWNARQARSGAMKMPARNATAPIAANATLTVPSNFGSGFAAAARTSSRVGA
jgi:hypothetical protein